MNKVVLYALGLMSVYGISLGFFGQLPMLTGWSMLGSLSVLIFVSYLSNALFARMVRAVTNAESATITALILFLILFPAETVREYGFLVLCALIAMASKYVVTWHKHHFFNPAAFGAVCIGVLGYGVGWWVGSAVMLPVVLIGGFVIVRKTRRTEMVIVFILAAVVSVLVSAWTLGETASIEQIFGALISWPIIFFGCVMLTEPLTLPANRTWQYVEAGIVGLLFAIPFSIGPLHSTPELALLIGNVIAMADGLKRTQTMRFKEKIHLAKGVYEFVFTCESKPGFLPGQYMECTLVHKQPDTKGNRRTFSIASSPSDPHIRFGVRVDEQPSSFKRALSDLQEGDVLIGSNLAGDFVLPNDQSKKLAFIAGGIGITPFRSMIQDMLDRQDSRDVILLYACKSIDDAAYQDVFYQARSVGVQMVCLTERLTAESIKKDIPDYQTRLFYLSGPNAMVESYRRLLRSIGVSRRSIRTDYFSGY